MKPLRTFVAISIPCSTEFPALVEKLKKNLHIPDIIEACRKVAKQHQPFTMDFDRTGLFGSNHSPRVLWLGMKDQPQALFDLEADILDAFDGLGYLRDRQNFVPHLTVCRIKQLVDKQFFMQIYNSIEQKTYLHADVKELVYFQSFWI